MCTSSGVLKMRGVGFVVLFVLVACATEGAVTPASAFSELRGWQTAAGKPPSKQEFAAVVAACEDRIKGGDKRASFEGCLADYGLRRLQ